MRVRLPEPVRRIYQAVADLEKAYPGRKFTPDGHLVGSIGEVVAAEALNLKLYGASHPGHDARDADGRDVQIKITSGKSVAMYATSVRLVVLKIVNAEEAEIVYDGPGEPIWRSAGKIQKNGQRTISINKIRSLASHASKFAWNDTDVQWMHNGKPITLEEAYALQLEDKMKRAAQGDIDNDLYDN